MGSKKVRLVPILGANEPVEMGFPDDMPVSEAINEAFPNARRDRVIKDEEDVPMLPSTLVRDANEIRFMPYSEGGF